MTELLKKFTESNEVSIQQILNNLLNDDNNLELKTRVHRPRQLSALLTFAKYLKIVKLPISSKLIIDFIKDYLKYMVSFKGLSRKEVIKAIANLTDDSEDLTGSKKLTTNFK